MFTPLFANDNIIHWYRDAIFDENTYSRTKKQPKYKDQIFTDNKQIYLGDLR